MPPTVADLTTNEVTRSRRRRRVAATRRLWHDGHRHRRSNPGRPSDIKTTLELGKLRSRLGESNPRPTHYERRDHRIHHARPVHRCTSERSRCTTTTSIGRHFRPRTRPRRRSTSCVRSGVAARRAARPRSSNRAPSNFEPTHSRALCGCSRRRIRCASPGEIRDLTTGGHDKPVPFSRVAAESGAKFASSQPEPLLGLPRSTGRRHQGAFPIDVGHEASHDGVE